MVVPLLLPGRNDHRDRDPSSRTRAGIGVPPAAGANVSTMTSDTDDTAPPDDSSGGRRSQVIATIVTLVTLIFVFFGVFPRFADYGDAWDAIVAMQPIDIVLLVAATIINVIVYVWPFQAAMPGLRFGPAFAVRQTSFAISNAVPAGGAFGLGVQYAMLSDYGYGAGPVTAVIAITSVWNILVTLGLPVLGVLGVSAAGVELESWVLLAAWIGLAVVGGAIVALVLVFRGEAIAASIGQFLDRAVARIGNLVRRPLEFGLAAKIVEFRMSTVDVVRRRFGLITLTSILQQLMQFFVLYLALYAIQGGAATPVTMMEAFAAFAIGRLGTFIPLTPGGVGTVDALMVTTLVSFGADQADAVAATLVWRAATYFPQVFIGIGTFLHWRGKKTLRPS